MSIIKSRLFLIVLGTTMVATAVGGYVWLQESRSPLLEIYIFQIKFSYVVFIRTPEDQRILVNGGPNSEIVRNISSILPFYSRHIDTMIATDDLGQNLTGLIDIVERSEVGRAFVPAVSLESLGLTTSSTDRTNAIFLEKLSDKGISIQQVSQGDEIRLDKSVVAKVLFPASPESFAYSRTSRPESLLKISYGSTSIVFIGDATKKVQKHVSSKETATVDVVVIYNNASETNLSDELMDKFDPRYLIYTETIMKGKSNTNDKKFTKTKTGTKSKSAKPTRLNIKERGMIKIVSDGHSLEIKNVSE